MADTVKVSKNLVARLKQAQRSNELSQYRAVIMHDFSLDRLVHVDSYEQFDQRVRTVLSQKGGLLPRSQQTLQQGGCGANAATTLARLGIETYFITRIDELGMALLEFYLHRGAGVNISHVKLGGRLALMTALEVGSEKINVMINDEESFAPFGFDDLEEKDLTLMESADLVGVFDWCLNLKGTDLASRLFDHLSDGEAMTYLDTSDPAPRKDEIPELFDKVLSHPGLSHLNLNENELRQYTGATGVEESLPTLLDLTDRLNLQIPAALSVHTATFAIFADQSTWTIPTYRITPLRSTGAGDSWNGGNMLGLLLKLEPAERLLLANAVAGYYVASPEVKRPNLTEVIEFIESKQDQIRELGLATETS
jgi:sugar/nucleoside kinase (ribokinase family)